MQPLFYLQLSTFLNELNANVQALFLTDRPIARIVDTSRNDIYYLDEKLGRGGFGTCFKATVRGTHVAIKIVHCCPGYDLMAAQKRELAKKEVALHMMLKHRHIVQLFHAFQVEDLTILTLELCVGGSIEGYLRKRRETEIAQGRHPFKRGEMGRARATMKETVHWMRQIADALRYLHDEAKIVHRDIKPCNVLLDGNGDVKVADFGIAFELRGPLICGEAGTKGFRAPEMESSGFQVHFYGSPVDIYAFGAMMYCLLFEDTPKKEDMPFMAYEESDVAWQDLLWRTLHYNPEKRPSASELRKHRFFFGGFDGISTMGRDTAFISKNAKRPWNAKSVIADIHAKRMKKDPANLKSVLLCPAPAALISIDKNEKRPLSEVSIVADVPVKRMKKNPANSKSIILYQALAHHPFQAHGRPVLLLPEDVSMVTYKHPVTQDDLFDYKLLDDGTETDKYIEVVTPTPVKRFLPPVNRTTINNDIHGKLPDDAFETGLILRDLSLPFESSSCSSSL